MIAAMLKWLSSLKASLATLLNAKSAERISISITTKIGTLSGPVKSANGKELIKMKLQLKRPVSDEFKISSPFGQRIINGKEEFHNGVDFACPIGTSIYACEDGAAFRCGYENEADHSIGFGLRVWQEIERIENDVKVRYYIYYGHLSKILIEEGSHIKKGQEIALSGNTGRTTGPHCHLGVRQKDTKNWLEVEFV